MITKHRGFTLIELLVVIAIIAILAAILFPVLSAARATARKGACVSNMKQIASAYRLYHGDYNDWDPRGPWGCKFFALLPYMKQTRVATGSSHESIMQKALQTVWMCPSADKRMGYDIEAERWLGSDGAGGNYTPPWWKWDKNKSRICRVSNSYVGNADTGPRATYIANPSKMVWYGESVYNASGNALRYFGTAYAAVHPSTQNGANVTGWCKSNSGDPYWGSRLYPWHNGSNFLYCDGHIIFRSEAEGPPPLKEWKNPLSPDGTPVGMKNN